MIWVNYIWYFAVIELVNAHTLKHSNTVNLEIFVRILFSRKAFKDIIAMFKTHDLYMIYLH